MSCRICYWWHPNNGVGHWTGCYWQVIAFLSTLFFFSLSLEIWACLSSLAYILIRLKDGNWCSCAGWSTGKAESTDLSLSFWVLEHFSGTLARHQLWVVWVVLFPDRTHSTSSEYLPWTSLSVESITCFLCSLPALLKVHDSWPQPLQLCPVQPKSIIPEIILGSTWQNHIKKAPSSTENRS